MKTDKNYHNATLLVSALLSVFFWCMASSFYSAAINLCQGVGVKWENTGISPSELVKYQAYAKQDGLANQPEVTLWQIYRDEEISAQDSRTVVNDMVMVFGDCKDITSAEILYGNFPARTDQSGCAVSSSLAFLLWGSLDVLGFPIRAGEDMLYVRGIFEGEELRLFRQAQAESKEPMSNMQLLFSETGTKEKAEHFLVAAGFSGGMILELPLIEWALDIVFKFPAILLATGIFIRMIKFGKKLFSYPALLLLYLPPVLVISAGVFLCMELPQVPGGFIPAMWSDFSFWKDLFTGHMENLSVWMLMAPTFRDTELMSVLFMTILFSIGASVSIVAASVLALNHTYRGIIFGCAAYTLMFGVLFLFLAGSHSMVFFKEMLLMPCLWLCTDFILYRLGEKPAPAHSERRFKENESIS